MDMVLLAGGVGGGRVVADGHSYERAEIEKWFATGKQTSPMTNAAMPDRVLRPNRQLKSWTDQGVAGPVERAVGYYGRRRAAAQAAGRLHVGGCPTAASGTPSAPTSACRDSPGREAVVGSVAGECIKFYSQSTQHSTAPTGQQQHEAPFSALLASRSPERSGNNTTR